MTSFHHQPEAQHPKFFSYQQAAGRLPHLFGRMTHHVIRYAFHVAVAKHFCPTGVHDADLNSCQLCCRFSGESRHSRTRMSLLTHCERHQSLQSLRRLRWKTCDIATVPHAATVARLCCVRSWTVPSSAGHDARHSSGPAALSARRTAGRAGARLARRRS